MRRTRQRRKIKRHRTRQRGGISYETIRDIAVRFVNTLDYAGVLHYITIYKNRVDETNREILNANTQDELSKAYQRLKYNFVYLYVLQHRKEELEKSGDTEVYTGMEEFSPPENISAADLEVPSDFEFEG